MAKKQNYLAMEVKKKGNGLYVDCGLLIDAYSRKQALERFREYADMNPGIVLTEKEARAMIKKLTAIFPPPTFTEKDAKAILRKHLPE